MIYAKSEPIESLREHTDLLLNHLTQWKGEYPSILSEYDWSLLECASEYHDTGKVLPAFQNKLLNALGKCSLPDHIGVDVPHQYASLLFLPMSVLSMDKEEQRLLMQIIAFHHERNYSLDEITPSLQIMSEHHEELQQKLKEEGFETGFLTVKSIRRAIKIRYKIEDDIFYRYVKLKGMLHRLDHAASAHVPIEMHHHISVRNSVYRFFKEGGFKPNELQQFAEKNREKSVIVIAQTGMGKTEAGGIWIGDDKGFFTLPFRVSINAQFDRSIHQLKLVDEKGAVAGLLHSGSLVVLEGYYEEGMDDITDAYRQAQLLSRKLTFCTVDQILKFPFLFKGFEKWLATLSYSKLVIDEIQAYSPKMLAVILKALQMIHQVGGRFMIMTATLPPIVFDTLEKMGIRREEEFAIGTFVNDEKLRHRISLENYSIVEHAKQIAEVSNQKRVLVICNTVRKAVEMYKELQNYDCCSNLLHSSFVQKDRCQKEHNILAFAPNRNDRQEQAGVWITTQLVEASVDVDFDLLFTELSTLDSLFPRFGRAYRGRVYKGTEPNIFIFTRDLSGVGSLTHAVYEESIVNHGRRLLESYDKQMLSESLKIQLVEQVYSKEALQGTKYLKELNTALATLETITPYDMMQREAQQLFRKIDSVTVIPKAFREDLELQKSLENYQKIKNDIRIARATKNTSWIKELLAELRQVMMTIEYFTLSIPHNRAKEQVTSLDIRGLEHIQWTQHEYNDEIGLHLS